MVSFVQRRERAAHDSDAMQRLRMQVTMEFNCVTPCSALKVLEELEPAEDDGEGAAIQHEYCYFREEVEAWADHGITPKPAHLLLGAQAGGLKMLRRREETAARFRLTRPRPRPKCAAGPLDLNRRSALNPSQRLPPPRSASLSSRGFGAAWDD